MQIEAQTFDEVVALLKKARDYLADAGSPGQELGQEAYAVVAAELSTMLASLEEASET